MELWLASQTNETYGDGGYSIRVSSYANWIDRILAADALPYTACPPVLIRARD
ncbi:hypothetical protein FB548_3667 [Pseudoxanthomonas sp. 3HH-4]|nr:hypothetical protein FB548_3667 [Pseudoxanthomonas sp. 3HH-4]